MTLVGAQLHLPALVALETTKYFTVKDKHEETRPKVMAVQQRNLFIVTLIQQ